MNRSGSFGVDSVSNVALFLLRLLKPPFRTTTFKSRMYFGIDCGG
jgi:hypothetical protein